LICKGDNGHWAGKLFGHFGGLAAGGISNLYYPANDRGAGLTFEMRPSESRLSGGQSSAGICHPKLTPHAPYNAAATP